MVLSRYVISKSKYLDPEGEGTYPVPLPETSLKYKYAKATPDARRVHNPELEYVDPRLKNIMQCTLPHMEGLHMYIHIQLHTHICSIYVFMHVCMHIYIYIYYICAYTYIQLLWAMWRPRDSLFTTAVLGFWSPREVARILIGGSSQAAVVNIGVPTRREDLQSAQADERSAASRVGQLCSRGLFNGPLGLGTPYKRA